MDRVGPEAEIPLFNLEQYSLEEILNPKNCALLVVDMQNDFLHPDGKFAKWGRDITAMQGIVPAVQKLIEVAHEAKIPVIFTQGFEDIKFRRGPDLRRAVKWGERDKDDNSTNSLKGTFGAEFYQVIPGEGDIVVEKHKWSAFDGKDQEGKNLEDILKEKGIKTLVITGVKTEVCVGTTVRDAYSKGYFVVVPREAVGSDNQELHAANLKNFDPIYGDVVNEDVIIKGWSHSS